ncbi:MAG: diacylglycerol kinase family lipid kinase [Verrucomicrobiae bacterium]|nr:diacylglycerol kinase family lipid kinase [Verrucomicrobiae bacterium]
MRACVIFNPAAKGDKAARFQTLLASLGRDCALRPTASPGDARGLTATAIREGFDCVVAAGGDGTLNEVLNGIGDVPDGFERVRLGILPLGTMNVFAMELGIPAALEAAWAVVRDGREIAVDLARANFNDASGPQRRYFAQMAGAGLDARAIERVSLPLKRVVGPLAYVWAGLEAICEHQPQIRASGDGHAATGQLVLLGNGRLYGGRFEVFPDADLRDGWLEVCVFPRADWFGLARCGLPLLINGRVPESAVRRFRAREVRLECASGEAAGFEVDGEWAGRTPVTFNVEPRRLRVLVP